MSNVLTSVKQMKCLQVLSESEDQFPFADMVAMAAYLDGVMPFLVTKPNCTTLVKQWEELTERPRHELVASCRGDSKEKQSSVVARHERDIRRLYDLVEACRKQVDQLLEEVKSGSPVDGNSNSNGNPLVKQFDLEQGR